MKNSTRLRKIILQTLLLNCVAAIFVILLSSSAGVNVRNIAFAVVYSFCIGNFCGLAVCTVVPRVRQMNWKLRILTFISSLFLAVYFGLLVGNTLLYLFGIVRFDKIVPLNPEILLFPLAIGLIFGGGAYFYESSQANLFKTKEQLRQKEIDEAHARRLATEARLASLESRIHPHFLFNTLNSIAALIQENPALAEKMVERLAKLLRYSLDANSQSTIALEQELRITGDYLEIEKVRFGERLHYRIADVHGFGQTKLPPLALQTLVENSIKHVAAKSSNRTQISVETIKTGDLLEITVRDNGAGFSENSLVENHGLDTLRKRLTTIFGSRAALEIAGDETGCVRLKVPLQETETIDD